MLGAYAQIGLVFIGVVGLCVATLFFFMLRRV